jgi:acyl-CoA reductase-like NAD-dependent aldehyde dehydrogenase
MGRLSVLKTYKLYIGGKFPRGESGRVKAAIGTDGNTLANYSLASRKDFRDAVVAARKAQPGWAKATAYLRGQILYRAAELLEQRTSELTAELSRAGVKSAAREVEAAVDRLVYYAGWPDKYVQVFGSVNPVSSPHFNFTFPEPTGVVAIFCPDSPALLGMVSLLASVILSGNSAVVLAGEKVPLAAITFSEILATSDVPGGVVNILTGSHSELAPHVAGHMDVNAVIDATSTTGLQETLRQGTANNLKRYARRSIATGAWFTSEAEDPRWILDAVEMKTAWHPMGV